MLTAMHHMDSTFTSPSPWQLLADRHLLYDLAPAPPPAPAAMRATPTPHHQHRPARRIAKRRPRPSRRLPTTYISAEPADFRRMVHQVTGAEDLPPPQPELLHRHVFARAAPSAAGAGAGAGAALPTLDTSAFLLAARTEEAAPAALAEQGLEFGSGGGNCGFPTLESWGLL